MWNNIFGLKDITEHNINFKTNMLTGFRDYRICISNSDNEILKVAQVMVF